MAKTIIQILLLNLMISLSGCQSHQSINTYLDQLSEEGKLNGNVLVTKDGKIIFEKSYGYTDGSKRTMLTKDYRFNIGSVYKEFPAVAIMQLQEKNQISLADKVSKYIRDLPKWSEKITIKNLLQYSSGLPLINWDEYFSNGINVNEADIMQGLQEVETLEFEPGTDYLYSNNNPILLMKIIEFVSQTKFNDYVQEIIFHPFQLKGTVIKEQYPYKDKTLMAIPFNSDFIEDDYKISVSSLLFSSTARDMASWLEQLDDFKIVSKQSLKTLSEKAIVGDNIQTPLGQCDWEKDDIIEHSHHGSTANYECIVRRFKKDGITIVILTNQKHRNVYDISDEIYEILRKEN